MRANNKGFVTIVMFLLAVTVSPLFASGSKHEAPKDSNQCIGAGPQSQRNIDQKDGRNPVFFKIAPENRNLNLCNIHFHRNAEHKAAAFSTYVEDGNNSGWVCQEPAAGGLQEKHAEYNGCEGWFLLPGPFCHW